MVLHGQGSQYWMTRDYWTKRQKALEKSSRFSDEELEKLEVTFPQGTGRTYWLTYEFWIQSVPTNTRYKRRKRINLRSLPNIA